MRSPMQKLKTLTVSAVSIFGIVLSLNAAAEVKVGKPAPDFSLSDQNNQRITLSKQTGSWVVLYFYPKNDTPGCTTEACSFRDNINRLIAQKAVILGVSIDSIESHQKFADKYQLPFSLLADKDGKVAEKYDAVLNLGIIKFARRHSFIIDPEGRIARIYRNVDPQKHVAQILKDLKQLQEER